MLSPPVGRAAAPAGAGRRARSCRPSRRARRRTGRAPRRRRRRRRPPRRPRAGPPAPPSRRSRARRRAAPRCRRGGSTRRGAAAAPRPCRRPALQQQPGRAEQPPVPVPLLALVQPSPSPRWSGRPRPRVGSAVTASPVGRTSAGRSTRGTYPRVRGGLPPRPGARRPSRRSGPTRRTASRSAASSPAGTSSAGHDPPAHLDLAVHRQLAPDVEHRRHVLDAGVRDEDDVGVVGRLERLQHPAGLGRHHVPQLLGLLRLVDVPLAAQPLDRPLAAVLGEVAALREDDEGVVLVEVRG